MRLHYTHKKTIDKGNQMYRNEAMKSLWAHLAMKSLWAHLPLLQQILL